MSFEQKYLKYKSKYLNLKMIGGVAAGVAAAAGGDDNHDYNRSQLMPDIARDVFESKEIQNAIDATKSKDALGNYNKLNAPTEHTYKQLIYNAIYKELRKGHYNKRTLIDAGVQAFNDYYLSSTGAPFRPFRW